MTRNEKKIAVTAKKSYIKVNFLQALQWRLENGFTDKQAWRHTVEETMAMPTPQERQLFSLTLKELKRDMGITS